MTGGSVLLIGRSPQFSPNRVQDDTAILNIVARELEGRGYDVLCISEDMLTEAQDSDTPILTMARSDRALDMMPGNNCINSADSIRLCRDRDRHTMLLKRHGIPIPRTTLTRTDSIPDVTFPVWIKRGQGPTQYAQDVCLLRCISELKQALDNYKNRGIETAVLQEHIHGDLIKFYNIPQAGFFRWRYAGTHGIKFDNEEHNGNPHCYNFDLSELVEITTRAAQVSGLEIMGGDAIITAEGRIYIIDINDWPSFSSCRQEAGVAIADIFDKL